MTNPGNPHLSTSPPASGSDELTPLVVAAAGGSRTALETLLLRVQSVAYRFSVAVCGHAHDAEDVMQEALLKAYSHVGRIREPEAFRPWLYRTVRNACLMSRRRRVHEPSHLLSLDDVLPGPEGVRRIDVPDGGASPEAAVANRRLRRRLQRAMQALPAAHRAVLFLREIEGLSTRETAQVLDITEDNVKTRLHRARLFLQQQLGGSR
ncbi:MAG: sigma-70 family RNA polymerase sigma factor [Vicinamibacterales bacterium]